VKKRGDRSSVFKVGHHDANHAAIVAVMCQLGPEPIDTSKVGGGYPDLTWGFQGQTVLVEVKTPDGSLKPSQLRFRAEWRGGPLFLVTCEADVLVLVEELTRRREVKMAVRG
jgi:hypothetical protein